MSDFTFFQLSLAICVLFLFSAPTSTASSQKRFPPDSNIQSYAYPPFVTVDRETINYTELLLDYVKEQYDISLSISAVKTCTARFRSRGESRVNCHEPMTVFGNMDCLIKFWEFQPYERGLTYNLFLRYFNIPACRNYTIVYDNCLQGVDESYLKGSLIVTKNPQVHCDPENNLPFAVPITEENINCISFNLHGEYLVYGIVMIVETILLKVEVYLKYLRQYKKVYRLQQYDCPENEENRICQKWFNSELKEIALLWNMASKHIADVRADGVYVRLYGTRHNEYKTNFHIIRSLKFLAKPIS